MSYDGQWERILSQCRLDVVCALLPPDRPSTSMCSLVNQSFFFKNIFDGIGLMGEDFTGWKTFFESI
jgi:hypothetical protein